MKQFKQQSREYKLLKSTWKLYLMKYDKLNKTTPHYDWHFKDYLTQEHVVLDGLDCNKNLENTYRVMQDFMAATQNKDEKQIIHLLHSKQSIGKQMHQTLLTFKHNLQYNNCVMLGILKLQLFYKEFIIIKTHFKSFKIFSMTDCFLLKNIFLQIYSSTKSKSRLSIYVPKIINILRTIILI